jgi:GTP-binding protein
MEIRNIAIIAHVDHGKTTLTDSLMRQTGMFAEGESMDSNALELERGITIYSKNTSAMYKGTKINIVDTPGHADFGSEVERVLRSIDCVLLIVDAQEGPMPQTRFVLKKSLELGLKPIVVINKIDKPAANPDLAEEQVLELFMDLGANKEQLDFPVVYAIGRQGIAKRKLDEESADLTPMLDLILEHVPVASVEGAAEKALRAQPFNLAYDNYLGRLAIARVTEGTIKLNDNVVILKDGGATYKGKVTKLFTFRGIKREEATEIVAGDIGIIAGIPDSISARPSRTLLMSRHFPLSPSTNPLSSSTSSSTTLRLQVAKESSLPRARFVSASKRSSRSTSVYVLISRAPQETPSKWQVAENSMSQFSSRICVAKDSSSRSHSRKSSSRKSTE